MTELPAHLVGDRFCDSCGYNLRGLTADRCPECGLEFDPNAPPVARIPWLQRSQIGTWRAYWRTVFAVTFHPVQFAAETDGAVGLRAEDAQKFRRILTWQGFASIATAAAISGIVLPMSRQPAMEAIVTAVALGLGSLLFLSITAVTLPMMTYRGHDEARLKILQHYSAAPLATIPAVAVSFCGLIAVRSASAFTPVLMLFFGLWLFTTVCMLGAVERYRPLALVGLTITTLLAWLCAFLFSAFVGVLTICVLWPGLD